MRMFPAMPCIYSKTGRKVKRNASSLTKMTDRYGGRCKEVDWQML